MGNEDMNFSQALEKVQDGYKIARRNWNGKGMYVQLQTPDTNSKMSLPYLFITTVEGRLVPWTISQTDALSADWYIVE